MATPPQQQTDSIVELDLEARRKRSNAGIQFEAGSTPPRVSQVSYESYLNGILYVGDVLLKLNGRELRTAQDFFGTVNKKGPEPHKLNIRIRRDQYYRININEVSKTEEATTMDVEIRWRKGGMPLGVHMETSERVVRIVGIAAGTVAEGHFRIGDTITHVSGVAVSKIEAARSEILKAINRHNAVTIRIERPSNPRRQESRPVPDDVQRILRENKNFWKDGHKYAPAIEQSQERQPTTNSFTTQNTGSKTTGGQATTRTSNVSRPRVRVNIEQPTEEDKQRIPVDNQRAPTPTPPRPGSNKQ